MADKKISVLTSASTVTPADYLVLVQSGNTLKVDVDTFFKKIPTKLVINEASEAIASGALSTLVLTSKVTPAGAPTNYTLAAGTHGMEKEIVCQTFTSGTAVVSVSAGSGFTTLTFNAVGDYVRLKNVDGFWYVAGNNSVVVA